MTPQFIGIRDLPPALQYIGCLAVRRDRTTLVCETGPLRECRGCAVYKQFTKEGARP